MLMNDEELRIKIYERLGLEIGSLASESGNDWIRAEKEILEEVKQEELAIQQKLTKIDYTKVKKSSKEFQSILISKSPLLQYFKVLIAQRTDLNYEDKLLLAQTGDRDVIVNLTKFQNLEPDIIDFILPNSVYQAKYFIIKKQLLNDQQKKLLLNQMLNFPDMYSQLLESMD